MIYQNNRQNFFTKMRSHTANDDGSACVLHTSFAEKYRAISVRTVIMLAGCLLLLAFCAVSVMQLSMQLQTEDLLAGAKAVCQVMTKGAASTAIPEFPGSAN